MSAEQLFSDFRLLIVDDDPQLTEFMRGGLKSHFSVIVVASSVSEARALLHGSIDFHAIVCDYHLADGIGMSLYHWLRKDRFHPVPFVLISGNFKPDSLDDPAFSFLAKPFHLDDLLRVLRQLPIQANSSGRRKKANKKVLIVDDEPAFTNIVKLALGEREGYEICAENNPRNAMATARKFIPDLLILDVVMPELDGGEVMTLFQADPVLRRIPIIFLTAIVRQKEIDENNGFIGGSFYVAKPVSADGLVGVIEDHLRKK